MEPGGGSKEEHRVLQELTGEMNKTQTRTIRKVRLKIAPRGPPAQNGQIIIINYSNGRHKEGGDEEKHRKNKSWKKIGGNISELRNEDIAWKTARVESRY